MKQTLYLLRGLPGAGKTTLAENLLESELVQHICEADNYFVGEDGVYRFDGAFLGKAHDLCYNLAERAILSGESVAVSNTFTTEREMEKYVTLRKSEASSWCRWWWRIDTEIGLCTMYQKQVCVGCVSGLTLNCEITK